MQSESSTVRDLLHARLDALLDECNLVTANADYGQTLDDMEEFFFTKGRKFLHDTFQEKLQEHIDRTEAASEPPSCPDCKKKRIPTTRKPKISSPFTVISPFTTARKDGRRQIADGSKVGGYAVSFLLLPSAICNLPSLLVLLSEGFAGMERELSALLLEEDDGEKRQSVGSLLEYLRKNAGRLNYRERLECGRVIGSGLIEGACKNLVGKRLKQTGACWRLARANRMAVICAVLYSDQWKYAH